MANDQRFVVESGLQTQNIEYLSSSGTDIITVSMLDGGTLSYSGTSGQLFSITNSLTGTIFAVNDISGVPSIEVDDTGVVRIAQYTGNVLIGTAIDNGTDKLQVNGSVSVSSLTATSLSTTSLSSSTVSASTSVTTPIVYDTNNTSYYVDPASTSNFYSITASQGVQTIYNANGNSYNEGIRIPRANNGYTSLVLAGDTTGSGSIAGQFNLVVYPTATNGGEFVIRANSLDSLGIDTSGNLYSYISTRSPIYYDQDNTSYYLDPASTSNLNIVDAVTVSASGSGVSSGFRLYSNSGLTASNNYMNFFTGQTSGWSFNANGTGADSNQVAYISSTGTIYSGAYFQAGTGVTGGYYQDASNGAYRSITNTGTGGYYFQNNAGANTYMYVGLYGSYAGRVGINTTAPAYNLDVEGTGYASGDFRAPIFYDTNNTAYYLDPSSTSNIVGLTVSAPITASINVYDTRGTVTGPNLGNHEVRFDFLSNSTDGLNDGGTYHGVMTFQQWTDASGGGTRQLGFTDNDNLWIRGSGSALTSYNAWKQFLYNGFNSANLVSPHIDIIYDSNNTAYYIDPASTSNLAYIQANNIYSSDSLRFVSPYGASYNTTTSTVTGAIKIALPTSRYGSSTMMSFTVHIYEYNTGQARSFRVGGYNYTDHTWYNVSCYQLTDSGGSITIRFGNDGTRNCVWIGETTTSWAYPQVWITDFEAGYGGFSSGWGDGWAISFVTAFDTVTTSRVPPTFGNTVYVGGDVIAYYSDARLKDFKGKITDPIGKIKQLNGYYFTENSVAKSLGYNNDSLQVGVSAQEVEAVLPEIVVPAPVNNEYKTVKYDKLVPLLIEAIKEQQSQIEELQKQIQELRNGE